MVNRDDIASELRIPTVALMSNVKKVLHWTAPYNIAHGTTIGAVPAGTYVYLLGKLDYQAKLVGAYLYTMGSALPTDKFWIGKYNGTAVAPLGTPITNRIMGSRNGVNGALRGAENKWIMNGVTGIVTPNDQIQMVHKHVAVDRLRGLAIKLVFR